MDHAVQIACIDFLREHATADTNAKHYLHNIALRCPLDANQSDVLAALDQLQLPYSLKRAKFGTVIHGVRLICD
jgi:hypothetical protein